MNNNHSEQNSTQTQADHEVNIRALVKRQALAWERNDFDLAAGDWLPDGILIAPTGEWPADKLRQVMADFHTYFTDLVVDIKNVFATADGSKIAIEWDWSVTRKADGMRSLTQDAIIVDLVDGKIKSWREYFDLSSSVEAVSQKQIAASK
jgi:uncharacterized protein (TIGR02246 family)